MERTTSHAFLVVVYLIIAAAIGFIVAGFFLPKPAPVDVTPPVPLPGWCCMAAGKTCLSEPKDAIACLRKGAKYFNRDRATCDRICSWLKK